MGLEEGLDTGPIYRQATLEIGEFEHAEALRARLGRLGCELLIDLLAGDVADESPIPQSGEVTYAAKILPGELRLDFHEGATICHRRVRIGKAWTTLRGRRLVILEARPRLDDLDPPAPVGSVIGDAVVTAEGRLQLIEVQAEGKRPQTWAEWALGARLQPDAHFD
jgi:methionyl-tRNA formyltransferase